MSRRPGSGGERPGRLGVLTGMTIAMFAVASVAFAAMSSISPSSGTVAPGGSTTATFTVTPALGLASCVVATVSPNPLQFSVVFDGVGLGPTNCTVLGEADVKMTVTASSRAAAGDYTVTVTEVALLDGKLLTSREWPLTVRAPATTTTTATSVPSTTTSTSVPSTTSTTSPATTSTQPGTTTSTAPTTTVATTPTTESASSPSATETVAATTERGESSNPGGPSEASPKGDEVEDLAIVLAATGPPRDGSGVDSGSGSPRSTPSTGVSDGFRHQLATPLFEMMADAAASPLGAAELLLRSLLSSARALFVPLLIATSVGLWMARRMRREVDDDELALQRQQMV